MELREGQWSRVGFAPPARQAHPDHQSLAQNTAAASKLLKKGGGYVGDYIGSRIQGLPNA